MSDKKNSPVKSVSSVPSVSGKGAIESFVADAHRLSDAVSRSRTSRLVFALDATMSRQPTWDLACELQGDMFSAAAGIGGLAVQLVYFRGFDECRASRWVVEPKALTALMTQISCRGGHTQIGKVLQHVRKEAAASSIRALVYVGDAMEEKPDELCNVAGELGLLGLKAFMFLEGNDTTAKRIFEEIARLTGGAYARFDGSAPLSLAALLRAAAVYASGGASALTQLAARDGEARRLLIAMERNR